MSQIPSLSRSQWIIGAVVVRSANILHNDTSNAGNFYRYRRIDETMQLEQKGSILIILNFK